MVQGVRFLNEFKIIKDNNAAPVKNTRGTLLGKICMYNDNSSRMTTNNKLPWIEGLSRINTQLTY